MYRKFLIFLFDNRFLHDFFFFFQFYINDIYVIIQNSINIGIKNLPIVRWHHTKEHIETS